jgi:hypothetical protein
MPDSLQIAVDFSAKFMIFASAYSDSSATSRSFEASDERGWMMRFRHEPDWHFPLAVNNLIRTSLRHPFSGDGITLRIPSETKRDRNRCSLVRQSSRFRRARSCVGWAG